MTKVPYKCDFCGKTKMIEPWRVKIYKHHFCSPRCMYTWNSTNVDCHKVRKDLVPYIKERLEKRVEYLDEIVNIVKKLDEYKQFSDKYLTSQVAIALRESGYKRYSNSSKAFIRVDANE